MTGLLIILAFIGLVLTGLPVAYALLLPGIVYFVATGFPISSAAHVGIYSIDKFTLLAIPLFVLAGCLMGTSGVAQRIYGFAGAMVAHFRGGLPQVNMLGSLIFAGNSGTALADIGSLGQLEIKAMTDQGYKKSFAAACTLSSATVGPIFPPSVPLLVYAAIAEVSAIQLLLAGILPGLLTTFMLMLMTAYLSYIRNYPRQERTSWRERLRTFREALPALLAPVVLMSGMVTGIFTATEAAAVTVLYVLFINAVVYREFQWSHLVDATRETVKITAVIMIIIVAASVFSRALALEQVPQQFAQILLTISANPLLLLLMVNVILLIVGMFLDMIGALTLLVPIIAPPLVMAGVDPVHLGLVVVFNLMVGAMTPPVGITLFMVSHVAKEPMGRVLRDAAPFMLILLCTLFMLTYIPWISTVLPSLVGG